MSVADKPPDDIPPPPDFTPEEEDTMLAKAASEKHPSFPAQIGGSSHTLSLEKGTAQPGAVAKGAPKGSGKPAKDADKAEKAPRSESGKVKSDTVAERAFHFSEFSLMPTQDGAYQIVEPEELDSGKQEKEQTSSLTRAGEQVRDQPVVAKSAVAVQKFRDTLHRKNTNIVIKFDPNLKKDVLVCEERREGFFKTSNKQKADDAAFNKNLATIAKFCEKHPDLALVKFSFGVTAEGAERQQDLRTYLNDFGIQLAPISQEEAKKRSQAEILKNDDQGATKTQGLVVRENKLSGQKYLEFKQPLSFFDKLFSSARKANVRSVCDRLKIKLIPAGCEEPTKPQKARQEVSQEKVKTVSTSCFSWLFRSTPRQAPTSAVAVVIQTPDQVKAKKAEIIAEYQRPEVQAKILEKFSQNADPQAALGFIKELNSERLRLGNIHFVKNENGNSILHLACRNMRSDVVNEVISALASSVGSHGSSLTRLNILNREDRAPLDLLLDNEQLQPKEKADLVKAFFKAIVPVSASTPISERVKKYITSEFKKMVEEFLEDLYQENVDAVKAAHPQTQQTPQKKEA
jgi:hypothetical protein